jgi:putative spermidine/putrescine transport system permease protein
MSNVENALEKIWKVVVWITAGFLILNILAMIASVVVNSVGTRWLGTWLPRGYTLRWYASAWNEFQLTDVMIVTFEIAAAVIVLSILLGVPAAYALARREFPGKRAVMVLFLLPLLVPPMTFGVPLATVLYRYGLAGQMTGVVLANLVPTVPFTVILLIPFIEQIDPRVEAAARVFGANTFRLFTHVVVPLLIPGILAATLIVMIRTVSMFELTFLTAGPTSQTLVVALYYSVFSAGVRAGQSIDAMAVIYMMSTLFWLIIALRFVSPTQLVGRVKKTA